MDKHNHIGIKLQQVALKKGLKPKHLAEIFDVETPSVYDWYKHGRMAKCHFAKLVEWSGLSLYWWLDVPDPLSGQVHQEQAPYLVKPSPTWPFTMFTPQEWAMIDPAKRDEIEDQITVAVLRAKKTASSLSAATHST